MADKSEKPKHIVDTSALISLGAIGIIGDVLEVTNIIITPSVINELNKEN